MEKPADTHVELIEVIAKRWSPRAFDPHKELNAHELDLLFEAARWAPSCFNEQPWRFALFGREDTLRRDVEHCLVEGNAWAKQASHLLVVAACTRFQRNGKVNAHAWYDTGAAVMSLVLQATALELSAHQMAGFDKEKLAQTLSPPEHVELIAVVALGHGSDDLSALNEAQQEKERGPRQRKEQDKWLIQGHGWGG